MTAIACVVLVCWLATLGTVYTIRKEERASAAADALVLERIAALEARLDVAATSLAGLDADLLREFREAVETKRLENFFR